MSTPETPRDPSDVDHVVRTPELRVPLVLDLTEAAELVTAPDDEPPWLPPPHWKLARSP